MAYDLEIKLVLSFTVLLILLMFFLIFSLIQWDIYNFIINSFLKIDICQHIGPTVLLSTGKYKSGPGWQHSLGDAISVFAQQMADSFALI